MTATIDKTLFYVLLHGFGLCGVQVRIVESGGADKYQNWLSLSRAYLNSAFYNTQFTAPSDSTGDITAIVLLGNYGNALKGRWFIAEFLDGNWYNTKMIDWGTPAGPSWRGCHWWPHRGHFFDPAVYPYLFLFCG